MVGLFGAESKFTYYGSKLWNLIWLNILTFISCIPLITTSASITAMHFLLIKIYKDENISVTVSFFREIGSNFIKSTGITLLYSILLYFVITGLYIFSYLNQHLLFYVVIIILALTLCSCNWSLILQARYQNSVFRTIRYSFLIAIAHPLHSILMLILAVIPAFLMAVAFENIILVVLGGFTLPGFAEVALYFKILKKMETSMNSIDSSKVAKLS